jgi:DnaK suppressor protein
LPNPETVRIELQSQLAHLLKRSGHIQADLRHAHERDSAEQATERENDEVLEGLDAITLGEVGRIRQALARIAEGTYGTCTTCGRAISEERLAAIPSALVCLTCSAQPGRTA